jgi:hypothetical protein
MSRFRTYSPDQAYLLPPSVKEVLPVGHLCFFLQQTVAKLDLELFELAYKEERWTVVRPSLDGQCVVVRLCDGDHVGTGVGATDCGGFAIAVSSGGERIRITGP